MATQCDMPSNSSNNIDYEMDNAQVWISISMTVIGMITILVNISAVTIVILTKVQNPVARNTHLLILGITDTLAGLSLFPILSTVLNPNKKIRFWPCYFGMFFFTVSYYNSIGQICVISIDRFFLLLKPSWRQTSKYERRYFRMLSIMFLLTFVSVCLLFFILGHPRSDQITCEIGILFCENVRLFSAISGGIAVFIQCSIITYCIAMIVVLQRHRRKCRQIAPANIQGYRTQQNQYHKMSAEAKSTLTIIIITINLIICVTPLNLGFIMQGLRLVETTNQTTRHVLITLSCINSAINPFVYCFRTPEVKATLKSGLERFRALFQQQTHQIDLSEPARV